jgi:hypothetical protein
MKLAVLTLGLALSLFAQPKPALKVTIEPKAAMKANVDVPFEVTVRDAKGAVVDGANVEVVATMVDMDHGEFKYEGKATKAGVYEVKPKFMMGGAWNLAVKATKGEAAVSMNKKIDVKD